MPSVSPAYFEENIPDQSTFSNTLDRAAYIALPQEWYVVITDIKNSTKAIEAGQYRDINAVGGSSIAAVLNATKPRKIPYSTRLNRTR
jgi:hypothetical protein